MHVHLVKYIFADQNLTSFDPYSLLKLEYLKIENLKKLSRD